jgi:flagellar motility protein MotE (MotC chaperone)
MCSRHNEPFETAEIDDTLFDDLIRLRDEVKELRRQIDAYKAAMKSASGKLKELSSSLGETANAGVV